MRCPPLRRLQFGTLALLCVLSCGLILPRTAAAHVLRQDGLAAAVMHIEPDDNPAAGQATTVVFDFSDSAPGFRLGDFTSAVTIAADGQGSSSTPLSIRGGNTGYSVVRFAKPAIYALHVRGTPVAGGRPFDLSYEIRVGRGANAAQGDAAAAQTVALVSVASFCILALVARQQIISGGRYRIRR